MSTATPRIIKAGQDDSATKTAYNFLDLRQRCEQYAAETREQCQTWIAEAKAESDAIRDTAYKEGRAAGIREGMADADRAIERRVNAATTEQLQLALDSITPALKLAAAQLVDERQRWLARWERGAVELGITIGERLTRRSIAADPDVLVDRIRELLSLTGHSTETLIHMHPDDLAALGPTADQLVAGQPFELVADQRVERGGCLLESRDAEIDAQITTQINRIAEELLGDAELPNAG